MYLDLISRDHVILVDHLDREIGISPKMEAHKKGKLHRAVSVFIFNSEGKWLLQQRASDKYHCADLWSNACCTHPVQGESVLSAASRRLMEEMGLNVVLHKLMELKYISELDNGLIENEYDHIFVGFSDDIPQLNPNEVAEYSYQSIQRIQKGIKNIPNGFTPWFKLLVPQIVKRQREIELFKT